MDVGHLRGVGDHRVDDDHRAAGILGDLVEHDAGAREALRHPRVLADEHRHLGVFELAAGVTAVEVGVDPRLTGLLLRERVGAVVRTEHLEERAAVSAAEMVALPAAAVVEDLVAAVGVGDALEARRRSRKSRCPSRFPRSCRRDAGAWGRSAGCRCSGSDPAATPCCRCSPARRDGPCRRGSWRGCGRRACTTMPQLHSHRMHAVDCQSSAASRESLHCGFPFRHSACSRSRSWPWTRSRGLRSREARATTIAPSIAVVDSIASSSARAADTPSATSRSAIRSVQRAKAAAARSMTGVAWSGLAGSPASTVTATTGTSRAVVGAKQLLAVVRRQDRRGRRHRVSALAISRRDILAGVIDCLAEQLGAATGKVVIRRAARGAAVFEHVGDRGRMRAAFPDQQRSRDHHPLAGTGQSGSLRPTPAMYVTLHNRGPRCQSQPLAVSVSWAGESAARGTP